MTSAPPSRPILVMTIQRFAETAWARHGPTRYLSVLLTPILVWLLAPGWWWTPCAAGAIIGIIIDLRARAYFIRLSERIDALDDAALAAAVHTQILALGLITAAYVFPYSVLAFGPQPGSVIGLLYCAGAALVCATLHVVTRTMIFYTIPTVLLGLVLNASALASGLSAIVLGTMACLLVANAVVAARAGATSFRELIAARLHAEQAAEDLEQRVRERTSQLAVATRRAQAANRAKSMFLANMSHELRTPLNAVIGYSEIIGEDLQSGDTAQCEDDLGKIRSAAGHLLVLINEVLDLSRIEAGKLELNPSDFALPVLLRGALDAIKPLAAKHRTTCQFNVRGGVELITADETRVRQCVLNLLSNAAKFTREGTIALDLRPCRIGSADGVAISVRDTGPGISAENLARLFQPFSQVDNSSTRAHDGAGLGLVITRRLARAMGGDVVAASKLGAGSTFTLYLPLNAAVRAAA